MHAFQLQKFQRFKNIVNTLPSILFFLVLLTSAPITTASVRIRQQTFYLHSSKLACQNQHGQPLDWFFAYKLARIENSKNENVRAGLGYAFLHPQPQPQLGTRTEDKSKSKPKEALLNDWQFAQESINDTQSIVGMTLRNLFQGPIPKDDLIFLTWNDQPPNGPAVAINAHSKGVIIANEKGAIWLEHSVPHFPNLSTPSYSYPFTGIHNGQLFMCSTLSPSQLDTTIIEILNIIKPHVFESHFPSKFKEVYPNLSKFISKAKTKTNSKLHGANISIHKSDLNTNKKERKVRRNFASSSKGPKGLNSKIFYLELPGLKNVTVFAKSPKFSEEIYSDWIAPTFNTRLRVQSWLNGAHPLPSNCTIKSKAVYNILEKAIDGNEFSTHSDHSKWAVSESMESTTQNSVNIKWICMSDLNRMDHQKLRGGAAICIPDSDLWNRFQNVVTSVQPCTRP